MTPHPLHKTFSGTYGLLRLVDLLHALFDDLNEASGIFSGFEHAEFAAETGTG